MVEKQEGMLEFDGMCISQEWTIDFWLRAGTPKEKLIVGIPTYGMSFTLEDPTNHDMKAAATGGGKRGKYTQEEGTLAYCEVWYILVDIISISVVEQFVSHTYNRQLSWLVYIIVIGH